MKDLYSNIDVSATYAILPVTGSNGSAPSAIEMDLQGANSAVILIAVGTAGSTPDGSNYWTFTMEHADDDGTGSADSYAAVAAADVQGVTPSTGVVLTVDGAADDDQILKIGYVGGKRFVKITPAETGTGPDLPQAVILIKGNLLDAPPIS